VAGSDRRAGDEAELSGEAGATAIGRDVPKIEFSEDAYNAGDRDHGPLDHIPGERLRQSLVAADCDRTSEFRVFLYVPSSHERRTGQRCGRRAIRSKQPVSETAGAGDQLFLTEPVGCDGDDPKSKLRILRYEERLEVGLPLKRGGTPTRQSGVASVAGWIHPKVVAATGGRFLRERNRVLDAPRREKPLGLDAERRDSNLGVESFGTLASWRCRPGNCG